MNHSFDVSLLIEHAKIMQQKALCTYSKFPVGAAIATIDNSIIGGFNIESASYGLTMCAERTALYSALTQNHREFTHIALVTNQASFPCGACRQMLYEFCPNAFITIATPTTITATYKVAELLPYAFDHNDLNRI